MHLDLPAGLLGQLVEALDHGRVARRALAVGRDVAVLIAGEQEAAERRVGSVLGARPPDHRLVTRARETDIREPQVLAPPLADVLALMLRVLPAPRGDIDRPLVAGPRVVEEHRFAGPDVHRVPQEREVHDGELEPLAAMDRQHLHGLLV